MRTVTRDDVVTPYGRCRDCECKTRSHLLEAAEYEIFITDGYRAPVNRVQAFSDAIDVEEYEMVTEPVVLCHKCWVDKQAKFARLIETNYQLWMDETILHVASVKKAVNTLIAYEFDDPKTIAALKNLATKLKEDALDG